ncbi:hypothetical protein RYH80_02475 [Halobaculum sp. MBLA0147]|uniref:DUF7522 family protein n=1 Tax=Halobaculum sp. MBLA0147 TaxID=3079934 RepID=UPI0035268270
MERRDRLLSPERAEAVTAAARSGLGDRLRSVTYFTPAAFEQVYLRSDLDADADLTGFVELARDGFHTGPAYTGSELGDYRYTVRVFTDGHLVRLTGDEEGVFVTAETLTIRRSEELAAALRGVLDGGK